jgi:hypothetical protein
MMAGQESDLLFNNLPPPYRALPTSPNVEDRRAGSVDYAARMKNFGGLGGGSLVSSAQHPAGDSMVMNAAWVGNPNIGGLNYDSGDYSASYNRHFNAPPQALAPIPPPSGALPYLAPHDPMSPMNQGWSPHGYAPDNSTLTPEQMNSALQLWQTGQ